MTQLELRPVETPRHKPADQNLSRVRGAIGPAIVSFFQAHVGRTFHADELRQWVTAKCGPVAPDSPRRIMGELRRDGVLGYVVENRAASLYRATAVTP